MNERRQEYETTDARRVADADCFDVRISKRKARERAVLGGTWLLSGPREKN